MLCRSAGRDDATSETHPPPAPSIFNPFPHATSGTLAPGLASLAPAPAPADPALDCSAGYFYSSSDGACLACTAAPGFACAGGGGRNASGAPCPEGHFCAGGAAAAAPCTCAAACPAGAPTPADPLDLVWTLTTLGSGVAGAADGAAAGGGADARLAPWGVSARADAAGTAYFSQQATSVLRALAPAGAVRTLLGRAGAPGAADGVGTNALASGPNEPALDAPRGLLYFADGAGTRLRALRLNDSVVSTLVRSARGLAVNVDGPAESTANLVGAAGVAVDAAGATIFVSCHAPCLVRALRGGRLVTVGGREGVCDFADGVGSNALFRSPYGLTVAQDGTVYLADQGNFHVRVMHAVT